LRRIHLKDLNIVIGNNLNKYRKSKKLSLDKVAKLSGVSKGMLGQIERGETNPSISTLWKIANALHISFTSLLETEPTKLQIVRKSEISPLAVDNNNKYNVFPVFLYDFNKHFETYLVELEAGCIYDSEAHDKGVEEYIYVSKGELELTLEGNTYILHEGDSIKYLADKEHIYKNNTNDLVQLHTTIYYNNSQEF
jgi:transcriptional regulator with XRE-family HTH domain